MDYNHGKHEYSLDRDDEKTKIKKKLAQVKQKLMNQCNTNANSFNDIEKVLSLAFDQEVCDHFTETQRKNIEMWKKQTTEARLQNSKDIEELTSVAELTATLVKIKVDIEKIKKEKENIQEETENLVKAFNEDKKILLGENEKKITALKDAYQLMQQNYIEAKKKLIDLEKSTKENNESAQNDYSSMNDGLPVSQEDGMLISRIAIFLNKHPQGASIDSIWRYLVYVGLDIDPREVENVMRKYNTVFIVSSDIETTSEQKWFMLTNQMI